MFKEEIKKLAALQVAERSMRAEKKASKEPRHRPSVAEFTGEPQRPAWMLPRARRDAYVAACEPARPYHDWFWESDARKRRRRFQIRVRHLLSAFHRGVPYKTVEPRTTSDLSHIAYWLTQALLYLEPGRADPCCNDMRQWLGAPLYLEKYPPVPSARFAEGTLGLTRSAPEVPLEACAE